MENKFSKKRIIEINMNTLFTNRLQELKQTKAAPHQLADHCQRLCDKLGIPFCTVIMRLLKKDDILTETLVNYMAEKHIKNIRYLTVAFYNQKRL